MKLYRYRVEIEEKVEMGSFLVKWTDFEKKTEEIFDASSAEIADGDLILKKKTEYQLLFGRKLFQFLDGTSRFFSKILEEASKGSYTPIIYLVSCRKTENWPFELLAYNEVFIVLKNVHLVRCVSERGAKTKLEPKNRALKILFMASSAVDVKDELNFEKEEEEIFKITENLAIDIDVEDSGSLEGLKEKLINEQYDIVHLSGHAGIKDKGPYFIMEDETGYRRDVYPSD
ncbi:MAG TPA: hypothetical protein VK255_02185, partial [Patescibacteria group bacterium]|nr:hypothetical protein [Patescibacteria group bacterium]